MEQAKPRGAMENKNLLQMVGDVSSPEPAFEGIKVNIASPCYRLSFSSVFAVSLMNLLSAWRDTGIKYSFDFVDTPDIELSRNFLLTRFYYELEDCSHILFIDNDMGFSPSLINRMIELNESVVGVFAPRRHVDLKKFHAEAGQPYAKAIARSVQFLALPVKEPQNKPGFIQVEHCGAGILLISRDCVTRMIECCPELVDGNVGKYPPVAHQFENFLTFFKKIQTDTAGRSEDYAFCHRWIHHCGGRIYANVDSRVTHRGVLDVETRYEDLFETDT